jgi:hypothetical protein
VSIQAVTPQTTRVDRTVPFMDVFQTSLHLDWNSECGNINQEGRGSHGSQYVTVAARKEPQRLFQNDAIVAGVVCRGRSISDSFSACHGAFSSKNSSGSFRRVRSEQYEIQRSQSPVGDVLPN